MSQQSSSSKRKNQRKRGGQNIGQASTAGRADTVPEQVVSPVQETAGVQQSAAVSVGASASTEVDLAAAAVDNGMKQLQISVASVNHALPPGRGADAIPAVPVAVSTDQSSSVSESTDSVVTAATSGSVKSVSASFDVSDGAAPAKSKAQLRAERRAIQEAQRAAKALAKSGGQKESGKPGEVTEPNANASKRNAPVQVKKPDQPSSSSAARESKVRVPDRVQIDDEKVVKKQLKKLDKQQVPRRPSANQKKVNLFRHLVQHERSIALTHELRFNSSVIHPAIIKLGLQYMDGVVCGSNPRCIALMDALKKVIADYRTPPNTELSRDLEVYIRPYISFLNQCRPLSVSMGNAIKYLKNLITHVSPSLTDEQAKDYLLEAIDAFKRERVVLAAKAISVEYACHKILDGDVVLVYACSSLIRKVLCDAHGEATNFQVIVVDSRPRLEGRQMLRRLVDSGIKCSYVLINSLSYVMKEVTKVFLGAHALLANGFVMSRVGSSQVALVAKAYNIPVLVCCETYKFCERVQTDSFVFNELGDPNDLMETYRHTNSEMRTAWKDIATFNVLNLVYDVTPPELISMVITELGMIPCTSVPVVLRVKCVDTQQLDVQKSSASITPCPC